VDLQDSVRRALYRGLENVRQHIQKQLAAEQGQLMKSTILNVSVINLFAQG
jgi:hypothetical protein